MERITVDPKIHFGKPIIKGTRITVQNVLELLNEGLTFDQMIQDCYPDRAIALAAAEDIHISSVAA
ncbi:MAG TPA: DUF433 domain-containing protein [Anaerolineales bacterium]|nr:DUF433 domain-containing protein [Anaerolineales bacterium]